MTSHLDGLDGLFVHPVQDPAVIAGNGTIGLEILEDLPDPDTVVIPYGGGGLTAGIASAVKALRPGTKIITAEPDTAAAMAAAVAAGHPADVDYRASFVDGSGSRRVLDSMWPLVAPLVDEALAIRCRRGRRRRAHARGAGPDHRRRRGRARSRGRAERPGRGRQGRVRGLGRQHQPGQARRDPRRGLGIARVPGDNPAAWFSASSRRSTSAMVL